MFNGKMKALTFSYDDGTTQDEKLISLFDRYGMKATFNLNSSLLGTRETLLRNGYMIRHDRVLPEKVRSLYQGHEIAAHTLTHPNLTRITHEEIIRQVKDDADALSSLCGYTVCGMAYPGGGENNNDAVAQVIYANIPRIQYARTITSTYSFDVQEHLLRFNPTVSHMETDRLAALAEQFIRLTPAAPKVFCIWGHSFEFDHLVDPIAFEEILKKLAFREDIFYGTNREVLLPREQPSRR